MIRQTIARVDLDAIRSNLRAIAAFLGSDLELRGSGASRKSPPEADTRDPGTTAIEGVRPPTPQIIAVVKANAYGHGAARQRAP